MPPHEQWGQLEYSTTSLVTCQIKARMMMMHGRTKCQSYELLNSLEKRIQALETALANVTENKEQGGN